jgi:membrane-associated phospholipid phosphatase
VPNSELPLIDRPLDVWSRRRWMAWSTVPIVLLVLLVTFVVLTGSRVGDHGEIERSAFIGLNHMLNFWPREVWTNLTLLGDAGVLIALLSPLLLFRPRAWIAMICAAPLAAAVSTLGKRLLEVPRPGAVIDPTQFTHIGHVLSASDSLPSGHSITVFTAVVAVLATLLPSPSNWRQWGMIFAGMLAATIVCLSRVAVGVHWPQDVVAGAAVGWLTGLVGAAGARHYQGWRWWRYRPMGRYLLVIGGVALGFLLLDRALIAPRGNPMLWLAGTCSLGVSFCLLMDVAGQKALTAAAMPKLE